MKRVQPCSYRAAFGTLIENNDIVDSRRGLLDIERCGDMCWVMQTIAGTERDPRFDCEFPPMAAATGVQTAWW
jgi:hypothetical protein